MTISVLYGARSGRGRLDRATQSLVESFERHGIATDRIDLDPTDLPAVVLADAMERQDVADAVIAVSPVYKGTYSGYLKTFLDFLPHDALAGKPVGIMAMGEIPDYAHGVEHGLRNVFAWFHTVVAPSTLYLNGSHFDTVGHLADSGRYLIDHFVSDFRDFRARHSR